MQMTIMPEELRNMERFKQSTKHCHECPICKKKIQIGIEFGMVQKLVEQAKGIYSHLVLHGKPLHGLVCYLDSHLAVRGIVPVESIEISRDSETFGELIKKWANPY